jgi:hypothetical protein
MRKPFVLVVFLCITNAIFAGSFIVNYYIRDVSIDALTSYASSKNLVGFLIEQKNNSGIVFCERESAGQDDVYGGALASSISKDLKCRVIYTIIHDSDVFFFHYYKNGILLSSYNSWPGYFEGKEPKPTYGNLDVFCKDYAVDNEVLKGILENKKQYIFADEILAELTIAISAPIFMAYASYNYMADLSIELKKENARVIEIK